METAALYIAAFLFGSIPTGYIIGRLVKGIDIRRYGSGNIGANNVNQQIGKKWMVVQAISDLLVKGAGSVWFSVYVAGVEWSSSLIIGPPLLVMAGNNWSPFLRFQGGRGLGVAAGTLLAFSPAVFGVLMVVYFGGCLIRRSGAGVWALLALLLLPVLSVAMPDGLKMTEGLTMVWYSIGIVGLALLKRLLANWSPFPGDLPRRKVFFNRLVRDRDVDDRAQWVERIPDATV